MPGAPATPAPGPLLFPTPLGLLELGVDNVVVATRALAFSVCPPAACAAFLRSRRRRKPVSRLLEIAAQLPEARDISRVAFHQIAYLSNKLLGAGLLLGVALWAKWGFAIAFDAIRAYCF